MLNGTLEHAFCNFTKLVKSRNSSTEVLHLPLHLTFPFGRTLPSYVHKEMLVADRSLAMRGAVYFPFLWIILVICSWATLADTWSSGSVEWQGRGDPERVVGQRSTRYRIAFLQSVDRETEGEPGQDGLRAVMKRSPRVDLELEEQQRTAVEATETDSLPPISMTTSNSEKGLYRGIANPLAPLTLYLNDVRSVFCGPPQPTRTVIADIAAINVSNVEMVLLTSVKPAGISRSDGFVLSSKIYPKLTESALAQEVSWIDMPDVGCDGCFNETNEYPYPVTLPSQREIVFFGTVPATGYGNISKNCRADVPPNANFCVLPMVFWSNGGVVKANFQNPLSWFRKETDFSTVAFTALKSTQQAAPNVTVIMFASPSAGYTAISSVPYLWQLDIDTSNTSVSGDWQEFPIHSVIHPPHRTYRRSLRWNRNAVYLFSDSGGSLLILFGGASVNNDMVPMTDVWLFNITERSWVEAPSVPRHTTTVWSQYSAAFNPDEDALVVNEHVFDINYIHILDVTEPVRGWKTYSPQQSTPSMDAIWPVCATDAIYLLGDVQDYTIPSSYQAVLSQAWHVSNFGLGSATVFFPELVDRGAVSGSNIPPRSSHPLIVALNHSPLDFSSETCEVLLLGGGWLEKDPDKVLSMVWRMSLDARSKVNYHYGEVSSISLPTYPRTVDYYGKTVNLLDDIVVLIGGRESPEHNITSLWCLNVTTSVWTNSRVEGLGRKPISRSFHASFALDNSTVVVVGGTYDGFNNDTDSSGVWAFEFSNLTSCSGAWVELSATANSLLPSMSGHTVTVVDGHILLCGGRRTPSGGKSPLLSLRLDTQTRTYSTQAITWQGSDASSNDTHGHILVPYTNNSLLLYGGRKGVDYNTEAMLLVYSATEKDFQVIDIVPFFSHPRTAHLSSVCNFIISLVDLSGIDAQDVHGRNPKLRASYIPHTLCLAGHEYNRSADSCVPCAVGNWSNGGSSRCSACPTGTSTNYVASVSAQNCTPCASSDFCNGHGRCEIYDNKAKCACHFGYVSSDNCAIPYILVATVAVPILTFAAVVFGVYKFCQQKRARRKFQRLLVNSTRRIQDLSTAWRIEEDQLGMKHVLGAGSYGEVWLANLNDMPVVVKKLHHHCLIDDIAVQEFQREAELMKTRRHQNLVLFLGAGANSHQEPFLVLEYVKRGALSDILADTSVAISHSDTLRFMKDAAKGMEYLHGTRPPTVHRDLKSSNLLVTERWVVKVADFGTARLASQLDEHLQQSVEMRHYNGSEHTPLFKASDSMMTSKIGTLPYQSPEMLRGEMYNVSTDVYR